jgi:arylsulfatase A-like enzyme
VLLAACSDDPPAAPEETVTNVYPAPYQAYGHDVIVIVLDTLRADHLSQYGYDLDTSPGLAALAERSTRFDHAWAPSPWTLPSTTSIHTGQHPLRHGLRHPGDVLGKDARPMAERLRNAGWRTAGFSHNVNVNPRNGFAQGFDEFTSNTGKVNAYPNVQRMTHAAGEWFASRARGPSFVYLQPMNCHGPYKVPDAHEADLLGRRPKRGFRYYQGWMKSILREHHLAARARVTDDYLESLREQYDVAIRYETDQVGEFLDAVRRAGRFDDALIVLTADHGEELFDHGGFSHGYSLHAEVLRVPLLVKLPGQQAARVVHENVSLLDVLPTVLEVAGVPPQPDDHLDGRSLTGLAAGGTRPPEPLVFDVDWDKRAVGRALADGDWKLVELESNYEGLHHVAQLYNIADDPTESHDLVADESARLATMQAQLATMAASLQGAAKPANSLTDEDRKQLEALGYLE